MRIATAGKGGSGKTTIAGSLARAIARSGRRVLAIDADTNPNLAGMLGLAGGAGVSFAELPGELVQKRVEKDGVSRLAFVGDPEQVVSQHSVEGADGVRLLVAGRVTHSGAG
jgi:CO dehydrogenase maturation factor